jgi:hypothetical protein
MREYPILVLVCCLVPLAALAATVLFGTPTLPTVLIALVALALPAHRLLTTSAAPPPGDHGRPRPRA